MLQSRENCQKEWISVASVITFACSDFARPDSGSISIEGYVHGNEHICLGSLKRWLPMNHTDIPKLLEITFEAIFLGRQQHDQRYTKHPTILKFLAETTTIQSDTSKRLRVDFYGSSEEPYRENHVRANTRFLRAKVRLSAGGVCNPTKTTPISESRRGLVTLFATWETSYRQLPALLAEPIAKAVLTAHLVSCPCKCWQWIKEIHGQSDGLPITPKRLSDLN